MLGRLRSGTLALTRDQRGLRYDVTLGRTSIARDTVESVQRGDLVGSSFKFSLDPVDGIAVIERAKFPTDMPLIEIRRVKELIDVGPVTFPQYAGTSVQVRSVPHLVSDLFAQAMDEAIALRRERRAALDEAKAWPTA
jgi:hypothetical protein